MNTKEIKKILKKILPMNWIRKFRAVMWQKKIDRLGNRKRIPFKGHGEAFGINLVGSIRHDTGLGQSCRLVARQLEELGIPYCIKNFSVSTAISGSNTEFDHRIQEDFSYSINLLHVYMNDFVPCIESIGEKQLDGRYNIAFWLWESEKFPKRWVPLINAVDEVWVPSDFIKEALEKVTNKRVVTLPYRVTAESDRSLTRADFGLPEERFLYLMMFDNNSIARRKNPEGVIEAYRQAFGTDDKEAGLIIKINNADEKWLDELRNSLPGCHIYFINEMLSKPAVNRLIELADVYISLHRSEGFGLVLAEAMLLGTPTISTNYSSTTEFQDENSACLVGYDKVPLGKDIYPYAKEDVWAEPHVEEAAAYIRRLYEDREYHERIRENAGRYVRKRLGKERILGLWREELERLQKL